jgi:hypothetical protein
VQRHWQSRSGRRNHERHSARPPSLKRFDGAALVIEISHDVFMPAAAPIRAPGQQRLAVRPKMLRPAVAGGGEFTAVVVTLTSQRAA